VILLWWIDSSKDSKGPTLADFLRWFRKVAPKPAR
jgi:hypothetical protein